MTKPVTTGGNCKGDTPRGEQAASDARVNGDGVPFAFSEAFGIEITRDKTPELYRLIINMREDAGDLATRHAKEYYMRVRPFSFFNEMTCNPEQQEELSTNGSYPSGHTAIGWATALVLAEVNPDRQNEILKEDLKWDRVVLFVGIISKVMWMLPELWLVLLLPVSMPTMLL